MPKTTTAPPGFPAEIPNAPDRKALEEVMVRCGPAVVVELGRGCSTSSSQGRSVSCKEN